jgi:hypothetical protein
MDHLGRVVVFEHLVEIVEVLDDTWRLVSISGLNAFLGRASVLL